MPKLKYKSKHKSSSKKKKHHSDQRHRHHHHHHHSQRHYSPPTIYDDDNQGSVPPTQAFKTTEEQEWREKLFEAMVDDEDPFYTFYNETNTSSSNYSDPHHMTDDAYADYMNQGMYRKRHADEIAQQEARRQAKAKRRQEKEQAQRKMEQEQEEHQQFMEKIRQQDRQRRLERDRQAYKQQWDRILLLQQQPKQQQQEEGTTMHRRHDVPWPVLGSHRITRENVRAFLVDHTTKELRQEQLRYHPDKFMTRIRLIFKGSDDDMDWIRRKDNEVSGWLNELWAERNGS
ncbi:hypothetical protein BCR42DRAFT_401895 [Absidia repens]|uniref:Uncharacterized protein n=1 Tax=Absidia repens TaxID=90262 RepID=A0A1X2IXE0_9FUNG|nr:hypothetical protein BCR42DRAFT_401895 [Absidia repens]